MQLAYRHDERPGESYEALDGKKNPQQQKHFKLTLQKADGPYFGSKQSSYQTNQIIRT